jgi:chromatin remodeling complex protein RSC6
MAEAKGLKKPVKLKAELAEFCGVNQLPRTEITKKLWDYIKSKKLQTKSANGKPENAGKFIVADAKLLKVFKNRETA